MTEIEIKGAASKHRQVAVHRQTARAIGRESATIEHRGGTDGAIAGEASAASTLTVPPSCPVTPSVALKISVVPVKATLRPDRIVVPDSALIAPLPVIRLLKR